MIDDDGDPLGFCQGVMWVIVIWAIGIITYGIIGVLQ
jgi:hypothetical protein